MWERYREEKLKSYLEAKKRGEVDRDIEPVLDKINERSEFVTLSSCSGRIAVLDLERFGDKLSAKFLGKWHSCTSTHSVVDAAEKCSKTAWFILYPPIIHVACKDLASAAWIMKIANEAGFRRCGIISTKNFVVEIASLERLELPIGESGKVILPSDYIELIVNIANDKLRRGKEKLKRFEILLNSSER